MSLFMLESMCCQTNLHGNQTEENGLRLCPWWFYRLLLRPTKWNLSPTSALSASVTLPVSAVITATDAYSVVSSLANGAVKFLSGLKWPHQIDAGMISIHFLFVYFVGFEEDLYRCCVCCAPELCELSCDSARFCFLIGGCQRVKVL